MTMNGKWNLQNGGRGIQKGFLIKSAVFTKCRARVCRVARRSGRRMQLQGVERPTAYAKLFEYSPPATSLWELYRVTQTSAVLQARLDPAISHTTIIPAIAAQQKGGSQKRSLNGYG